MATTKVVTKPLVRFSYAHVFEPHSVEGGNPKYSVSVIIPKTETALVAQIEKAIATAAEEGKAKLGGKVPKNLKTPLRDGDIDREDDETYANSWFIGATSSRKPGLVDKDLNPIIDPEDFYSGCYGRVALNFYVFNTNGNKGVAAGLNNIQKVKDGDRLGGSAASAENDFGDFNDDDLL